jgi:hypothetical protein
MFDALSDDLTYAQIFLGQTKQDGYFLWPVTLPKDGADMSEWSATALEHIEVAKTTWIRLGRNKESNGYARTEAETPFPDPTWENLTLSEFMRIAFKGEGVIASPDHPYLPFAEIWLADTEYASQPGEHPTPVCYCAKEWRSGRTIKLFQDELRPCERN